MKFALGCGSHFVRFNRVFHTQGKHVSLVSSKQIGTGFTANAARGYSTGPLFGNHNNTFRTTTRQGAYGSTEVLNQDLVSDAFPRVKLAFEVVNEHTSTYFPKAPVIILHGLFGNRANNRTIARQLNERLERDVYLPDLRNHGLSPHIGRHDYPSMAADVELFIQEQQFQDAPIIVGHSMGAKVAMSVVLRKPQLCSMLVSIDNAPVATMPTMSFPRYVKKLLEIIENPKIQTFADAEKSLRDIESSPVIRQFLLTILQRVKESDDSDSGAGAGAGKPASGHHQHQHQHQQQHQNQHQNQHRFKSRIPLGILNDAIVKGNIANWEFNPWVHQYTSPSLFIRGTRSHYVSDETLQDVGRFFPRFELRDIDATHWVNTEKPRECSDLIADFIERNEEL
ncbi:LAME_0A06590g1_1 [Lachancea meyersii CBS 8951]|uniref:LAME_0A06590g1_1 n=1 Tax=Lachancea meyersii CBS 8951 TaxID=1266667 RepID=A0A1G4IQF2_9SACH|nr:LAME_0A06590g1_1 [Lachancea meyersii CBS 8951]